MTVSDNITSFTGDAAAAAQDCNLPDRRELALVAVERTTMPMVVTDPRQTDNPIVLANQAFLDLTGYSAEEIIGRNCRFLQGPETAAIDSSKIREWLTRDDDHLEVELLNYRKDGSTFWNQLIISPVYNDAGVLSYYFGSQRNVTGNHQSREAIKITAAELKHRLGNTYQMITSLMVMTARGNATHEEFANQMADRLSALRRSQSLFTENDAPCELDKLIPALVTPFGNEAAQVSFGFLPTIAIHQSQADAIALVMGELAVNSSKHGAFRHGGAVNVAAAVDVNDAITVVWREHCDVSVEQTSRKGGQGLKLMDQIMRARNGSMVVDWEVRGIVATLKLGLSASS